MSIKILSKNIYNDIENSKIIDNVIDKIEINSKIPTPNNGYNYVVYNQQIYGDYETNYQQSIVYHGYTNAYPTNAPSYWTYAIMNLYYTEQVLYKRIEIPKQKDTYDFINSIITGFDEQNKKGLINCSISYYKYEGISSVEVEEKSEPTSISGDDAVLELSNLTVNYSKPQTIVSYPVIPSTNDEGNIEIKHHMPTPNKWVSSIIPFENKINLTGNINFVETEGFFGFDISLIVGYELIKIDDFVSPNATVDFVPKEKIAYGTCEKYVPQKIEISVSGDTIGISLVDNIISVGKIESSKKPFSIDGNELIQSTNYYDKEEIKNLVENQYENTLNEYKNGKETATILCDIGEYYNQQGEKAISTIDSSLPMTFKIGDEVIPYVYGADGQDHPMSLNKDGSAKVFRVLGTEIYYDGAVWQKLTLQEI